jgi:HK97 gp10 family phage protein
MIDSSFDNQLNDLLKDLNTLEDTLQNKVVRSGLVALSKPIKNDMAANAPKNEGYLEQSINHKSLTKGQKTRLNIDSSDVAILVGPNKKVNGFSQSKKANLVEFGVKAHVIEAKYKTLKLGPNGFAMGKVKHPGIKANPFMEKALKSNESNITGLFYQGMAKTLDKIRAQ